MDKLNKLITRCKAAVYVEVNAHKDIYKSVEQYIEDEGYLEVKQDAGSEIISEMIKRDTIIQIYFYPDTPIGFYTVWHCDLDMALDKCIDILDEQEFKI